MLKLFSWLHIASGDSIYQFEIQLSLSRGPGRGLHLPVARKVLMDLPTPPLISCSFSLHLFFFFFGLTFKALCVAFCVSRVLSRVVKVEDLGGHAHLLLPEASLWEGDLIDGSFGA